MTVFQVDMHDVISVSENICERIESFGLSVANQPSVKRKD